MSEMRPRGSNADEWHLFLCQRLDNRATYPNGLEFTAVQIAEAIEAERKRCISWVRWWLGGDPFESGYECIRNIESGAHPPTPEANR
jgi:hypothetical protein